MRNFNTQKSVVPPLKLSMLYCSRACKACRRVGPDRAVEPLSIMQI